MARIARDTRLETHHARRHLPAGKRRFADTVRASLPGFGTEADNVTPLRATR